MMLKIAILAGLVLSPAIASAQLGAGMGTNAYAQPHSPEGDIASGAAGTPVHKSHVAHADARQRAGRAIHHDGTRTDVAHPAAAKTTSAPR